jgi:acyl-CoA thioester hydrolase
LAGRSARDDAADRSLRGEGMVAGASQLRRALRSRGEGTRGPYGAVGAEAVLAERRKLDDEVEGRPESLSELREHAFGKVRPPPDGSADFLQVPLQPDGRLARMPEPFRHRLRVRWSECDLQGVVFYPNYLAYFDHLLTELWREAVGPYGEIHLHGIDLVVAEANIRYRSSARFDDEIDVVAAITRLGTTSMTTDLRIERVEDGAVLAEGDLRHVFVSPDSLEKRDIPVDVRGALERFAVP